MGEYPDGFRKLLERLATVKIKTWGVSYREDLPYAEEFAEIEDSHVVSSLRKGTGLVGPHAVVLDIDHPTWLVRSSTAGHFHLYIDVPGGIPWDKYENLLYALAQAGVIEQGYFEVSKKRNRTDVRLPWIKKGSA